MKSNLILLFSGLLFAGAQAFSQFEKSELDDLKSDLSNFAASGCTNQVYLKSAMALIKDLSSPISGDLTPAQAKANDQLRDALRGIRSAMTNSMGGDTASCTRKMRDGIKMIDALPTNQTTQKSKDIEAPTAPKSSR